MNGWSSKDVAITGKVVSGIVSNQQITVDAFPITAGGSRNMVIKIKTSAATVVGTITVKLQTACGSDWVDSKSTTIAAAGSVYIKLLEALSTDQQYLPLLNQGRVVVTTTNAGDSITLQSVEILQEL